MNLPLHRRYIIHRRIGIDAELRLRRKIAIVLIGVLLYVLISATGEYMHEHNLRLTRENELRDILAYQLKPRMGAPGTKTDMIEGTTNLEVRKP